MSDILKHGAGAEILIRTTGGSKALERFADQIVAWVLNDHPDYDGKDKDINADAALIANIIPRLVNDFNRSGHPN